MTKRFIATAVLLLCTAVLRAQEPVPKTVSASYVEREFRMEVPDSFPGGLDVLEVYVNTPAKHPLVLLTHGTAETQEERLQLTPWLQLPQAIWFARRGYVALVIVRRGYGTSGGKQDSTLGGCRFGGSFEEVGEAAAADLRAAVEYANKKLPEVDTSTVISVGGSTGGFTQAALAANPPKGLKATISFAGGNGGDGKGHLCNETGLIGAYKSFGKHARTPMLWIYAENDKWFPPLLARKFLAAFEQSGGDAEFIVARPDGEDGHGLFNHVPAWSLTVEDFLQLHDLLPVDPPYPGPVPPKIAPPAGLSPRELEAFNAFLILGPFKALARNGKGTVWYTAGQFTQALADQHALENCNKAVHGGPPCSIVARTPQQK